MIDLFIETFFKGGIIVLIIFAINIYAWYYIISKMRVLHTELKKYDGMLYNIKFYLQQSNMKELLNLLSTRKSKINKLIAYVINNKKTADMKILINEVRLLYDNYLTGSIGMLKTVAGVAPLLGLLGTVTGMMKTFSVIKLFGNSNPVLMADGISEALLTTQAGLIVAFPIMLMVTILNNKIKRAQANFEMSVLLFKE